MTCFCFICWKWWKKVMDNFQKILILFVSNIENYFQSLFYTIFCPIFIVNFYSPETWRRSLYELSIYFKCSRSQMFFKISVLKIFSIYTGKQLCCSLFLRNLQLWRPVISLEKRLHHRCFSVYIVKFLRMTRRFL